ncbi:hypothetical protein ACFWIB_38895 [Streptomyces sp. NPDC127051]|uniref:hypothetical protein n=1 Tax=Streptomyces sp. NPDC127051 TaxID=3347119 RepID=UPI0036473E62
MTWIDHVFLRIGQEFTDPKPNSADEWAQVVYTVWQLISQGGERLTETEQLPATRPDRERDAQQGISGSSDVQVVNVHAKQRPTPGASEKSAAASSSNRAPQYAYRWPVSIVRHSHCMNPPGHAESSCQHVERIIMPYPAPGPRI